MGLLWTFLTVTASFAVKYFLLILLTATFFAFLGKSLGLRRLYVQLLLRLFEYAHQHIEVVQARRRAEKHRKADEERRASICDDAIYTADGKREGTNPALHENSVIRRNDLILAPDPEQNVNGCHNENISKGLPRCSSVNTFKQEFLTDSLDYIKAGIEAIIEDDVIQRFEAVELKSWNLLTRTNRHYHYISIQLTVIWLLGLFFRYFVLLPIRATLFMLGMLWLMMTMTLLSNVRDGPFKRSMYNAASRICYDLLASGLSAVITFHNPENRAQSGVCVANHTTPVDAIILMSDNLYSLTAQRHGGIMGIAARAVMKASPHIFFERSEIKDREAVANRLRAHVADPQNPPILIFPEGTCVNNTSVMQFKKGSFEVGGIIHPVTMKYYPKFGDAFWNSQRHSMTRHLYMIMSSWAIVCDVWYLPPMYGHDGETAADFANRVKSVIARQGGLVDLMWDGGLKRTQPKKELKEKQQEELSKRFRVSP